MSVAEATLVAVAGFGAGAVNAAAGGGTLLSFPALLAAGVPALTANITSSVGLLAGYAGGSVAYREELAGQGRRVKVLGAASVVGGVAGAVLLLVTSDTVFRAVVPFLLLLACALLLVQPRVAAWVRRRRGESVHGDDRVGVRVALLVGVLTVYGSYFGAGLGVVLLAALGIALDDGLQRLNALKGLLSLIVNAAGVAVFLVSGHVDWGYAGLLAVTSYAGGHVGVGLARRISPTALRAAVVILGVVVAVVLLVR
ncbi:MAG: uncharacterized protein QOJ92_1032 [Frankiales bacterium]|nr:uncharacterized protein [Frankiales bacterium]